MERNLKVLNRDILSIVITYISYIDIINLRMSCRHFFKNINRQDIWKNINTMILSDVGYYPICPSVFLSPYINIVMYHDGTTEFDPSFRCYGKMLLLDDYRIVTSYVDNIIVVNERHEVNVVCKDIINCIYLHYNEYKVIDGVIIHLTFGTALDDSLNI